MPRETGKNRISNLNKVRGLEGRLSPKDAEIVELKSRVDQLHAESLAEPALKAPFDLFCQQSLTAHAELKSYVDSTAANAQIALAGLQEVGSTISKLNE